MKKLVKVISLVLAIMSLVDIAAPALAETGLLVGSTAYTIKGDVAVRKTGSSSGAIITRVNTGTQVTILQNTNSTNGYYKVSVSGVTSGGYIREDCLGSYPLNGGTNPPQTMTAAFGSANLYSGCPTGKYVKNLQLCLQYEGLLFLTPA